LTRLLKASYKHSMNTRDRQVLGQWRDYLARLHKQFAKQQASKALLVDFLAAINSEIVYLRHQYPGVEHGKLINRAYQRLVKAYERSAEYSVYLNWPSIAAFTVTRRPGIAWAVLQARADRCPKQQPELKPGERPFMVKPVRTTHRAWCPRCYINSKIVKGKYECCGERLEFSADLI
jgi:hypothetical protein